MSTKPTPLELSEVNSILYRIPNFYLTFIVHHMQKLLYKLEHKKQLFLFKTEIHIVDLNYFDVVFVIVVIYVDNLFARNLNGNFFLALLQLHFYKSGSLKYNRFAKTTGDSSHLS